MQAMPEVEEGALVDGFPCCRETNMRGMYSKAGGGVQGMERADVVAIVEEGLVGVGIRREDTEKVGFEPVDTAMFVGGSVEPGILEVGEVDDGKGEGIGVAVHSTGISESGLLSEDLFGAPCAMENVEIVDLDFAVPLAIATADLP
jgi:hypothetical protein